MKSFTILLLTGLTLCSGLADARGRSGGGFGGSRGSSYSSPSRSSSIPRYNPPSYSPPSYTPTPPRSTPPSYTPPRNNSSNNTYTSGSVQRPPRQRPTKQSTGKTYPSNSIVRNSPLNTAAAARVTPSQLSQWNKVSLPAGVSRSAITYSAAPSSQYRYQLQPGRYYPYPQSYYRQHNVGYDILKYAVIFSAVSSVAGAMTPNVVVNNSVPGTGYTPEGNLRDVATNNPPVVIQQSRGPNLWTYLGVGFLAAGAAWFLLGRRRQ